MAGLDTSTDSVLDGLKKLFGGIANLKLAKDAPQHMDIISGLEQIIMQYLQQQTQKAAMGAAQAAGGQGQPGGQPGMPGQQPGMPQQMPGGGLPGGGAPQQIAPGGGAGMSGLAPQAPNPDELRRVLGAGVG